MAKQILSDSTVYLRPSMYMRPPAVARCTVMGTAARPLNHPRLGWRPFKRTRYPYACLGILECGIFKCAQAILQQIAMAFQRRRLLASLVDLTNAATIQSIIAIVRAFPVSFERAISFLTKTSYQKLCGLECRPTHWTHPNTSTSRACAFKTLFAFASSFLLESLLQYHVQLCPSFCCLESCAVQNLLLLTVSRGAGNVFDTHSQQYAACTPAQCRCQSPGWLRRPAIGTPRSPCGICYMDPGMQTIMPNRNSLDKLQKARGPDQPEQWWRGQHQMPSKPWEHI